MVLTESEIDYIVSGGFIFRKPIPGYSRYTLTLHYLPLSRTISGYVQGKKNHKQRYYSKTRKVYYKLKNNEGKIVNIYFNDLF